MKEKFNSSHKEYKINLFKPCIILNMANLVFAVVTETWSSKSNPDMWKIVQIYLVVLAMPAAVGA